MHTTPTTTKELAFTTPIQNGATGMKAKRVQEWLGFHGYKTGIDSSFGPATEFQVKAFQTKKGLPVTGVVNRATWDLLVAPLVAALSVHIPAGTSVDDAILRVAKAHLKVHPLELGGDNCGVWVRVYTDGNEGSDWRWCAGFVTFVMKQACAAIGAKPPVSGSVSCDTLAAQAKAAKRFVPGASIGGANPWPSLGACQIFLVRRTSSDWVHTGFSFAGQADIFSTIEGNTNDEGSSNGYEVCQRQRGIVSKDFIKLV